MNNPHFMHLCENYKVIVTHNRVTNFDEVEVGFNPEFWTHEDKQLCRPRFRIRIITCDAACYPKFVLERLNATSWRNIRCSDMFRPGVKKDILENMCERISITFSEIVNIQAKKENIYLNTPEKRHEHRGTLSGKKFGF